jgi:hypothetical protein
MSDLAEHISHLRAAELQFRLASAVRLATTFKKQPLDLPIEWTHGKQRVRYGEVALSDEQADFAAWNLRRCATFLMASAIRNAIRSAYQVSRLIRNAFAHAPFRPVWSIDADCRSQVFVVQEVISLDTKDLHGRTFDWRHYGGPLALFRLSNFVRMKILKDSQATSAVVPIPKDVYFQQGDVVFRRVLD